MVTMSLVMDAQVVKLKLAGHAQDFLLNAILYAEMGLSRKVMKLVMLV